MVLVLEGTLYRVPEASKNWLPYLFLGYLAAGIVWHAWQRRKTTTSREDGGRLEAIADASEMD
jgi:hypothetical protein